MGEINIVAYLVIALSSFINIIVPISGSAVITPLLAIITNPHTAIGLVSFYFVLSGVVRITLFRQYIVWKEVKQLLPVSLVMGIGGALFLVSINSQLLYIILFVLISFFILKKLGLIKKNKKKFHTVIIVGLISGFLQGTGLAGSEIRNAYLYGQELSIKQVHGTTAVIGSSIFFIATVVRLLTNQITIPNLIPLLYVFPIIVLASLLGRFALGKINKKTSDGIIIAVMVVSAVGMLYKIIV